MLHSGEVNRVGFYECEPILYGSVLMLKLLHSRKSLQTVFGSGSDKKGI